MIKWLWCGYFLIRLCVLSSTGGAPLHAEKSSQALTPAPPWWTLGKHQHSFSADERQKTPVPINTALPSAVLFVSPRSSQKNLICFLPLRDLEKGKQPHQMIYCQFSSLCATFNIYLRDSLPLPTSSTESAAPVTGSQIKDKPVTSRCPYQWQPSLPLKLSSLWLWWAAATLNLLPAQTHSLPKLYSSTIHSPDIWLMEKGFYCWKGNYILTTASSIPGRQRYTSTTSNWQSTEGNFPASVFSFPVLQSDHMVTRAHLPGAHSNSFHLP